MYPRSYLRRVTGLHRTSDLLSRVYDGEVRNAAYLTKTRSIIVLIYVALVDGEIRKFSLEKVPVDALTCATPVGREIY